MIKKLLFFVFSLLIFFPIVSSAHYIVGYVENPKDGALANGRTIMLWGESPSDYLTDIIGPSGNSGADNIFMIDCEMLSSPCTVGQRLNLRVIDDGNGYTSANETVIVTGFGYTLADNITINSPPKILEFSVIDSNFNQISEVNLLVANTRKTFCRAIVRDYDGTDSLLNASAVFFDKTESFFEDADDNNKHYTNLSCFINHSHGAQNEAEVLCGFDLWYYANSGNWNCSFTIYDNFSISAVNNTDVFINELLAIGVNNTLSYNEIYSSGLSNEGVLAVYNYGNAKINISLFGYGEEEGDGFSMVCPFDKTIPIENQKYNLTHSTEGDITLGDFEPAYSPLGSDAEIKEFNLDYRKNQIVNDAFRPTYWRIRVPESIEGTCSGNIVFGATTAEAT
jgi:hypothetical protein